MCTLSQYHVFLTSTYSSISVLRLHIQKFWTTINVRTSEIDDSIRTILFGCFHRDFTSCNSEDNMMVHLFVLIRELSISGFKNVAITVNFWLYIHRCSKLQQKLHEQESFNACTVFAVPSLICFRHKCITNISIAEMLKNVNGNLKTY